VYTKGPVVTTGRWGASDVQGFAERFEFSSFWSSSLNPAAGSINPP